MNRHLNTAEFLSPDAGSVDGIRQAQWHRHKLTHGTMSGIDAIKLKN
jgi:hypothetical protein